MLLLYVGEKLLITEKNLWLRTNSEWLTLQYISVQTCLDFNMINGYFMDLLDNTFHLLMLKHCLWYSELECAPLKNSITLTHSLRFFSSELTFEFWLLKYNLVMFISWLLGETEGQPWHSADNILRVFYISQEPGPGHFCLTLIVQRWRHKRARKLDSLVRNHTGS